MGRGFYQRGARPRAGRSIFVCSEEGCSVPRCWVTGEGGDTYAIGLHVRRLCAMHRHLWELERGRAILPRSVEDESFAEWIGEK